MTLDARRLIAGDLQAQRRQRAQHFRAALLLAALGSVGLLTAVGLRPDLLRQPPEQLVLQLLAWTLAFVALPAVGLGLWFPGPRARWTLVGLSVAVAALVAAGPALLDMSAGTGPPGHGLGFDYCTRLTLGSGALVLAVGALSGAFAIRRRPSSALWLAGAVALIAIDTTTWHCPWTQLAHTLPSHAGAGALTLGVAALLGVWLHRRQRA